MKETFWSYYAPDENLRSEIWDSAIVVLDTNVLLSLYRHTSDTRSQFLTVLEGMKSRLWIPHQIGFEFQQNRIGVIRRLGERYEAIKSESESIAEGWQKALRRDFRHHPSTDVDELLKSVQRVCEEVTSYADSRNADAMDLRSGIAGRDEVRAKLDELYAHCVGKAPDEQDLSQMVEEASRRADAFIPPGYKDQNKDSDRERSGDYILWEQLLREATDRGASVIFVTDDQKEDWWLREKGLRLGPRRELREELMARAGTHLLMFTPERFLEGARALPGVEISDEAVREVETTSQKAFESVICPHCQTGSVEIELGLASGDSALTSCEHCRRLFHIHRDAEGGVFTRQGSLGSEVKTRCPSCERPLVVRFANSDGEIIHRVCLSCYAQLQIDPSGRCDVNGAASVVDTEVSRGRMVCVRCRGGIHHPVLESSEGKAVGLCLASDPVLVLRSAVSS